MGMGEPRGQPVPIIVQEANDGNGIIPKTRFIDHQPVPVSNFARYIRISIFTTFVLSGQAVATLLGRLYFDKGGNSKWMATLVQTAGFPVLLPFLFLYPTRKHTPENNHAEKPSLSILVSLYLFLGIFYAANCMLFSIGLAYLPVSTVSLIAASQLAFNAFFSYFLNAQKLTPLIINSLVLLTMSSTLLVFQNDQQESSTSSKTKYAIGFLCSVCAAATAGLLFSVIQLAFRKILKRPTFKAVFNLLICQCSVASFVILIGLFASREWKTINGEMEAYKLGKVPYMMTLVGAAVSWQVFSMGIFGLIFEVSSLFSNVISALGLPIVPVCAMIFFHDKMTGVKVVAMLLAIWGFASYIYQHYLDEFESKTEAKKVYELSLTDAA